MVDMLGQLIQVNNGTTSVGDNQFEINLQDFAKGVYEVVLEHGNSNNKQRLVVE